MNNMPIRCRLYRAPDAPHSFDPVSGWCRHGCGAREDGKVTAYDGHVIKPGPAYTAEELATIADHLRNQTIRSTHEQAQFDFSE